MQVQRVQNNNNYNTNFGAKLQTKGMENLPKKFIKELTQLAKPIGEESDIIAIHLNGTTKKTATWTEMGHYSEGTDLWQNIDTATFIDGKLTPKRIGALVDSEKPTPENVKSIKEAIVEFFNVLKNGEKEVVKPSKAPKTSKMFVMNGKATFVRTINKK